MRRIGHGETPAERLERNHVRAVDYMLSEITHICRRLPKRAPGSAGERAAAEYMANTLKKDCNCDEVKIDTFEEHPSAFYGYFWFSAFFDILSWAGFYIHPIVSIVSGCIALFLFIFQFCLYKQIIDPIFPKRESVNVTAVRYCTGKPKQRIFLNGHIDAAWEFPLNHRFGGIVFEIPGVAALFGVLTIIALSICELCGCNGVRAVFPYLALLIPFFALVGYTYDPRTIVDGANDDLSGCYMGIAVLRELEMEGIRLAHTEVGVILTGSEEAGLRGAKAWGERYRYNYKDVPTYIISYDTIHDPKHLMVNERDLNGTQSSDKELAEMFLNAEKRSAFRAEKAGCRLSGVRRTVRLLRRRDFDPSVLRG